MAARGRGAVGEFSCPDCLMDDIRKIAARQVFRSHTPQICCIAKVMLEQAYMGGTVTFVTLVNMYVLFLFFATL